MSGPEFIVVDGLTKRYGEVVAVDGVSFRVFGGEVFSLLGPNGAGKTTTVEVLECLRSPTSGKAYIKGLNVKNPSDVKQIKKIIGVLPQEFNAVDELTVYENVQLSAVAKKAGNVREVLELLGLWEIRGRRFSKLSGGLKRRVGIAMALVGQPEIVFLDEPTTGLDPEARRETWLHIKNLKKSGVTTILTTHYMDEAERLSDRVAIIVKGKIAAEDEVKNLIAKHRGKIRLVFEPLDQLAVDILRRNGYEVEVMRDGQIVVKVDKESEMLEVIDILRDVRVETYPEIKRPGLEDVFLSVIGSKISERGELI